MDKLGHAAGQQQHSGLVRYGLAAGSVAVAAILRALADPLLGDRLPYFPFYVALVTATGLAGLGPGLFALFLGLLTADFFFTSPRHTFAAHSTPEKIGHLAFIVIGVGLCLGLALLRRARARMAEVFASLAAFEQHLNCLLRTITDGLVIFDAARRIRYANRAAREIIRGRGVDPDGLIGKVIFREVFADVTTLDWGLAFERTMSQRTVSAVEDFYEPWKRWYLSRFFPMDDGGVAVLFQDTTERKHAEQRLQMHSITSAFAQSETLQEVTPTILRAICITARADAAAFWRVDQSSQHMCCIGAIACADDHAIEAFLRDTRTRVFKRGEGLPGRVWAANKPEWIPDTSKDDNLPRLAANTTPFRSAFAIPIRSGDEFLGALEFFSAKARRPDDSLVDTLSDISVGISQFIERSRSREALRKSHQALREANQNLEDKVNARTAELVRSKAELEMLSYGIVHDLRAPLRAINGYAELLERDPHSTFSSTARDYLQRIKTAGHRLDRLIQDVLGCSRLLPRQMPLQPIDADKLVRDIIESYPQIRAPEADIEIEGKLPSVVANEAALTQCMSNLIENAVKFARPRVRPRVRIRGELLDRGRARLSVQDNGIGIDPMYWDRIFQMFQRVDNRFEGTGIGLTVVRQSVERMNGKVGLESRLGEGSTFWIDLASAGPDSRTNQAHGKKPELTKAK